MKPWQLLLMAMAVATWIVGANVVVVLHYKRVGKPWTTAFQRGAFPFRNFIWKEWLVLALLAALSFTFIALAVRLNSAPYLTAGPSPAPTTMNGAQ